MVLIQICSQYATAEDNIKAKVGFNKHHFFLESVSFLLKSSFIWRKICLECSRKSHVTFKVKLDGEVTALK